jgi:uncharacterized protein (DUF885 family)
MRIAATSISALLLLGGCQALPGQAPESTAPTVTAPAGASDTAPVASASQPEMTQTEAINVFFEEKFDESVARSPILQTYLGIKDDYGEWDDASMAAEKEELEIQRETVAEMKRRFDYDKLDKQAKLSWRMAEYQLERAEADWPFRYHSYTFNQMFGVQSRIPAFMINQHRVASESDARAYIDRLIGIPDYLGQNMKIARDSYQRGIQPPAFVYDYVISDAENMLAGFPFTDGPEEGSPLYVDFEGKLDALVEKGEISEARAAEMLDLGGDVLRKEVGPAYRELIDMLKAHRQTATSEDGVWKLPDGQAYYNTRLEARTTTDMTAAEVHQLGLQETDRIHDEMRGIMQEVGFEGSLQEFFEFIRTDERFYKPNTEEGRAEYLAEAKALIDEMRTRLPEVFNRFPEAEMIVKRVEPFREKSAGKAFYQRPAPDGSRPGIYYANLHDMADMPTYQMEALAYHEGIPGHHMQLAIQQELEGIPSFRRYSSVTAYTEGWGLYSEYLPREMGFYEDPYSDFGRLAMELWRAARLVVDTGLHSKQWSREEATQWLLENTPNPEGDARKAIDRYIVMPGQATAYKIGMIKILQLRERARAELGERFDIRDFHDVILENGPLPLSILEEQVEAWIAETKTA